MRTVTDTDWIADLLVLFEGDETENLSWQVTAGGVLRFAVKCTGVYRWATPDSEPVTAADLPELLRARADAHTADEPYTWPILWVSRKRGLRPMRAYYQQIGPEFAAMLDACGPERDPGSEG